MALLSDLVHECGRASTALLESNLSAHGILAAARTDAAAVRRYTRIFGRDAAICVMAMSGTGSPALEHGAIASVDALAAQQAGNGQIPKYVDPDGQDADFWYLGCIDATLWWLIAVNHVRSQGTVLPDRWSNEVALAIQWLQAQEHQHFRLLQQNEASDWADIMPRSGFVLYTNALWYEVKRRFSLAEAEATHHHFNHLFNPFQPDLPEYHRARLLRHYARRGRRDPGMYLSFVNLSFVGDEGDVFGNLLALLFALADESMAHSILHTIGHARAAQPWPVRVTLHPLAPGHPLWRNYMTRHRQNLAHQYHNGGIWPFVGGYWVLALARLGRMTEAVLA
ncbi:MAG: glycoside hydrolase, partial [Comamonadaceae bacterium]